MRKNGYLLMEYGSNIYKSGDAYGSLTKFKEAEKYLSCLSLSLRLAHNYYLVNDLMTAEKYYIQACNMVPNRFKTRYMLYKFYKQTEQRVKCKVIALQIMNMPIKIPSLEIDIIKDQVSNDLKNL